jgi:sulfur carrier protein
MSDTVARVELTVNGEAMAVARGTTLAELIATLGLDTRKVAVERNLEIVPRSTYTAVVLDERDALEIVHFIGGG